MGRGRGVACETLGARLGAESDHSHAARGAPRGCLALVGRARLALRASLKHHSRG